jgi:fucose permease
LGFLLATAYGAAFHFIIGGRPRKLLLYVSASWIGFIIGHFIGDFLGTNMLSLGAIHLLSASIGSWLAIISSWILSERET